MASTIQNLNGPEASAAASAREPSADAPSEEHKTAVVQRILQGELSADEARAQEGLTTQALTEWVRVYRRATRRAVDEQVAAALSAQGLEVDDFVLSGNLETMAVAELIETIQYGRKDAYIRIEHEGQRGHIWCMDGDIVDARSGALVGAPAVYRLLSLRQGRLQADFSKVMRPRTIEASTQALMLESAKRFDECRALRERIGDTAAIYLASPPVPTAQARLDPAELDVLSAFDGERSIDEIVQKSTLPDLETLAIISSLLGAGWLVPKSAAQKQAPAAPAPPAPPSQEMSVLPFAQSLRSQLSEPANARRWVWAGLAASAAALPLAFAVGFWSARRQAAEADVSRHVQSERRSVAAASIPLSCAAGMSAITPAMVRGQRPDAELALRPYCLSQREVTTAEYAACVAAGRCDPAQTDPETAEASEPTADPSARCNAGRAGHERHAINCVTFRQAQQYCAWRGGRLPTEGEWELAARVTADGRATTGASASIRDLQDGVSEWTSGRASQRPPSLEGEAVQDLHVVLGGGIAKDAARAGRATRLYMSANAHGRSVGFRCAASPDPPAPRADHNP